jgi:hypothetical protein
MTLIGLLKTAFRKMKLLLSINKCLICLGEGRRNRVDFCSINRKSEFEILNQHHVQPSSAVLVTLANIRSGDTAMH